MQFLVSFQISLIGCQPNDTSKVLYLRCQSTPASKIYDKYMTDGTEVYSFFSFLVPSISSLFILNAIHEHGLILLATLKKMRKRGPGSLTGTYAKCMPDIIHVRGSPSHKKVVVLGLRRAETESTGKMRGINFFPVYIAEL